MKPEYVVIRRWHPLQGVSLMAAFLSFLESGAEVLPFMLHMAFLGDACGAYYLVDNQLGWIAAPNKGRK